MGHLVKIEVEVEDLDGLEQALEAGVDAVLLDNMGLDLLARAVERVAGRAITKLPAYHPGYSRRFSGFGRRSHIY